MALHSLQERFEIGRAARKTAPRTSHAEFTPAPDRRDPIEMLQQQNATRVPWLVPVRHARMGVSAFTFYRGTAGIMAADLSGTPNSGLQVQLGGDAHLTNFGAYASPERALIGDANDFDETHPGPWEWDVKRLAASFTVAARDRGFTPGQARSITAASVAQYRIAMARFAAMGFLDLWYEHSTVDGLLDLVGAEGRTFRQRLLQFETKARTRTSLNALSKLAEDVDGRFRLRADHPVLVPVREVLPDYSPEQIDHGVREAFAGYLNTLRPDRRMLLERYEILDIALKVVGVGSVGTRCYVMLLEGRDHGDPLFLQAKEANDSVLEPYLGASEYPHHGQRVVVGQRMIQAQSDIFLGWTTGVAGVEYYFRQLRDWKGTFDVERSNPQGLGYYAAICGYLLARGHARTGDAASISGYLGKSRVFDDAIVAFSERYADQTERDYQRFREAVADGVLPVSDVGV